MQACHMKALCDADEKEFALEYDRNFFYSLVAIYVLINACLFGPIWWAIYQRNGRPDPSTVKTAAKFIPYSKISKVDHTTGGDITVGLAERVDPTKAKARMVDQSGDGIADGIDFDGDGIVDAHIHHVPKQGSKSTASTSTGAGVETHAI